MGAVPHDHLVDEAHVVFEFVVETGVPVQAVFEYETNCCMRTHDKNVQSKHAQIN